VTHLNKVNNCVLFISFNLTNYCNNNQCCLSLSSVVSSLYYICSCKQFVAIHRFISHEFFAVFNRYMIIRTLQLCSPVQLCSTIVLFVKQLQK